MVELHFLETLSNCRIDIINTLGDLIGNEEFFAWDL